MRRKINSNNRPARLTPAGWLKAIALTALMCYLWSLTFQKLNPKKIRIAYIGNSILFVNDCPGLLAAMMEASGKYTVEYDACLTGGASFSTILTPEVGCTPEFQTSSGYHLTVPKLLLDQKKWDFVVLQDQTMAPYESNTRRFSIRALNSTYVDPIHASGAQPVFFQTAAYSTATFGKGATYDEFTQKIHDGYHQYADLMTEELAKRSASQKHQKAVVAHSGEAFAELHRNHKKLWEQLYMEDDPVHPNALGTWLQACVLYATLLGEEPPAYSARFWNRANSEESRAPPPLPTPAQAKVLRKVAIEVVARLEQKA